MDSITKARISDAEINTLIQSTFGNSFTANSIIELTDGMFNSAFKITLNDNLNTVLKISPPNDIKVMRYEKNIMHTEVTALNQVSARTTIPVPKVYYFDNTQNAIDSDYFFMSYIEGMPLHKLHDALRDEQRKLINCELGAFAAQLNTIRSDYFGYISQPDKRFGCWADAFISMLKELLEDAADINEALPISSDELLQMVEERREILSLVKTPAFVHKDLWEGNIFVDTDSKRISGIVDFERALFGDALLEPVCGFLLENRDFMSNYLGKSELSCEERTRAVLYRIFLYLIMFVETGYRKYSDGNVKAWAGMQLELSVKELMHN